MIGGSDVVTKMNCNMEEDQKNVQREVEGRAKDVKAIESEVVGLRGTL